MTAEGRRWMIRLGEKISESRKSQVGALERTILVPAPTRGGTHGTEN